MYWFSPQIRCAGQTPGLRRTNQQQRLERSCTGSQICADSLSQDGNAWVAANDGSRSCYDDYSGDPSTWCSLYGTDSDQYGMNGTQACCICGGGACAPENPVTRQSLMDFYISTSGEKWDTKTNWASNQSYCQWSGIICASGTSDVIYM